LFSELDEPTYQKAFGLLQKQSTSAEHSRLPIQHVMLRKNKLLKASTESQQQAFVAALGRWMAY
jgi:ribosomal protein S3AE